MSEALRRRYHRILLPLLRDIQQRFREVAPENREAFLEARLCERFRNLFHSETNSLGAVTLERIAHKMQFPVQGTTRQPEPHSSVCDRLLEQAHWRANALSALNHFLSPVYGWLQEMESYEFAVPETLYEPVYSLIHTLVQTARDILTGLEDPRTPGQEERAWHVHDRMLELQDHLAEGARRIQVFRETAPGALEAAKPQPETQDAYRARTMKRMHRLGLSGGPIGGPKLVVD